jgi:hypothetical protein
MSQLDKRCTITDILVIEQRASKLRKDKLRYPDFFCDKHSYNCKYFARSLQTYC